MIERRPKFATLFVAVLVLGACEREPSPSAAASAPVRPSAPPAPSAVPSPESGAALPAFAPRRFETPRVTGDAQGKFANIEGRWEGFHDDVPVVMTLVGTRIELEVANMETRAGDFSIDASHDPAHLDVQWDGDHPNELIVERIDADHLKIENNLQLRPRPTEFTPGAIILTRTGG